MKAEVTELNNAIRDLLEAQGDKVGMGTENCKAFKKSHKTCEGCQYELGCSKLVHIMLTTFTPSNQGELIDNMLAAKTVDEVKAIPIPIPDFPELIE